MKVIITLSIFLITITSFGQPDNPWKGKPKTIEEAYLYLDKMFDDTAKYTFMTLPEDIATSRLHDGFGMWMRNNWGLWRNSHLKQCLIDSGFFHPDDMSAIILNTYHRRLNGKPLNFQKDAERYNAYWEKAEGDGFSAGDLSADHDTYTTVEELMKFFPVGDTILTSIFAEKKGIFQKYASSVKAVAIIREQKDDILVLYLLSIHQLKKHRPKHKAGETIEQSAYYCSLIPPVGWKWTNDRK